MSALTAFAHLYETSGMVPMVDRLPDSCPCCAEPYLPGRVHLSWQGCGCAGAPNGGHRTVRCDLCGYDLVIGHVEEAGRQA